MYSIYFKKVNKNGEIRQISKFKNTHIITNVMINLGFDKKDKVYDLKLEHIDDIFKNILYFYSKEKYTQYRTYIRTDQTARLFLNASYGAQINVSPETLKKQFEKEMFIEIQQLDKDEYFTYELKKDI